MSPRTEWKHGRAHSVPRSSGRDPERSRDPSPVTWSSEPTPALRASPASQVDPEEIHQGPPLALLAIASTGLFLASLLTGFVMTHGAAAPFPVRPLEELQVYSRFPAALRVASFLLFASAIPLGLFTAVIVSRLLFLRVRVAGVHIALFGGVAASIFMAASAFATWTLSQPGIASDLGATRAMTLLAFAAGGFGHLAALGLLLAGVSVPALVFGLMPRWICWLGLIVAGVAELSSLGMLFSGASPLLPLARFPALVWLIAAALTMPTRRLAPGSAPR